jgi:hypothetical protein
VSVAYSDRLFYLNFRYLVNTFQKIDTHSAISWKN